MQRSSCILLCVVIAGAWAVPVQFGDGCLFDGVVYAIGDKIVIPNCLGVVTCLGNNQLGEMEQWGGICPEKEKREVSGQDGCLFDGTVYQKGEKIVIAKCLGEMTCLGNNNYGDLVSWGGVCPEKREVSGQDGCLFDGTVYQKGEKIVIAKCLGEMTCLGNNNYGDLVSWGGVCPEKREVSGQDGCLFDGTVYQKGEKIVIAKCLGEMTCLGNHNYGDLVSWGGVCPEKREVSGQDGCLFDGTVYQKGEKIVIAKCLGEMTCLGNNNYGDLVSWGGVCPEKREVSGQDGCLFDGTVYQKGEKIVIAKCLGEMTCLGNNNYGDLVSWGGVCPEKRQKNGQTGCLFDGKVYSKGDKIVIGKCLATMTCLGNNSYSPFKSLGGVC